ncbi:MAG: hydrogenase expression/formation protein HypE [Coriobacteriales bacterium]|jgi:hydrogenase expression/formation protein HypE|nr:hydrogenase expression/formation protein HypE [Coriobacteriales bacterium]
MTNNVAANEQILLAHGSGGTLMRQLIEEVFYEAYGSAELLAGDDAATLCLPNTALLAQAEAKADAPVGVTAGLPPGRLAFSTDTFVVTPRIFPGGDIGRLAVCGTVNDVATSGARPLWLSVGLVLEEGLALSELKVICQSMAAAAAEADVSLVTGDTKVVQRGHGDGVYINTSGIGVFAPDRLALSGASCKPGDAILLSGTLGDHGIAIIACREQLSFQTTVISDAAPLNHLISAVLAAAPDTRCFRDPTRGGLASTLNELAAQSQVGMLVEEAAVPVQEQVRGACEMLGYDVFQVANEGKMVAVVPPAQAEAALAAMRGSHYGADAAIIGEVVALENYPGAARPQVLIRTPFGTTRIMDVLTGEQLPRIC